MSSLLLANAQDGTFWMPPRVTELGQSVDSTFYFIYWLCVIFFVLIVGALVLFAFKYRRRSDDDKTSPIKGHHKLELIWSIGPGILLFVMFGLGLKGFVAYLTPPADAMDIRVIGQKWSWAFTYPNGGSETADLYVPVGQPVRLTMSSTDVLHSFFVPAFRVKRDVVPNRYTVMWFQADEPGEYPIFCTEFCGTDHSRMLGTVHVVPQHEYDAHIDTLLGCPSGSTLAECGEVVFARNGCTACHGGAMEGGVNGPPLAGLFGRGEQLTNGTTVCADGVQDIECENYIRQSIVDPNAEIVAGWPEPSAMPTFAGRIDDEGMNALIEYIRSTSEN